MKPRAPIRLQKYMADCGLGSRRFCETLITAGRVKVDGETVLELGTRIEPGFHKVECNGKLLVEEPSITLLMNKPPKIICTSNDPQGRKTALDLLDDLPERVYTVGRLDFMSEGLILITNDGALTHALMHPKHHIEKTYRVWVNKPLGFHQRAKAMRGIPNQGETLRFKDIDEGVHTRQGVIHTITLEEGKNRHIRRMMEHFDRKVFRLQRTHIGTLELDDLKPGEWRRAKPAELKRLRTLLDKKSVDSDEE